MSPISPQRLRRFIELPQMAAEAWQGGLVRLPSWIERGPDDKPYRPWAAMWVSARTGRANQQIEPAPGAHDHALALEALVDFGLRKSLAGCRPERIEVADEGLAAHLRNALGSAGSSISVVGQLPAVKAALASFAEYTTGRPLPPDAMDAPGVTIERMRAFADAARAFYLAAPWRHLSDEDLIRVESPQVDPGLRYLSVLGGAGITFGLGFFNRPEELDELLQAHEPEELLGSQDRWTVWFGPISELSFGDVELWEEHALPVAGEEAYPVAVRLRPDGEMQRPDAGALADLEALLLALAATDEEEIDHGRWTKEVRTYDGPTTVTLSIPALLEPLDAPPKKIPGRIPDRRSMERVMAEIGRFVAQHDFADMDEANRAIQERFVGSFNRIPSTASTPLEKAQDLVYRAFEARGRRRIQLARKALELSPDCADAYVVLAEEAADPDAARDLYVKGVEAGGRALGPAIFEAEVGRFWGLTETRPYMRARFGLAQCLEEAGHTDEAIGHYQELLRLNPSDNQGIRDILLPVLLAAGRDSEAGALLTQYEDDASAAWKYGWALWTFRREGDSPSARERLREALRANRHAPKYLSGKTAMPEVLPDSYSFGSMEEAVITAHELGKAWQSTPGADRWLLAATPKRKPQTRRRR